MLLSLDCWDCGVFEKRLLTKPNAEIERPPTFRKPRRETMLVPPQRRSKYMST
jgi:hypothetical protein